MPDPRSELEQLRKLKRLKELEQKAGIAPSAARSESAPPHVSSIQEIQTTLDAQVPDMVRSIAGAQPGVQALPKFVSKPINKLADYLMQKAVGMRKYFPGIGNELIDQGLIGTKNRMASQVEEKLPEAEAKLQEIIKGVKGTHPASQIADDVALRGSRFTLPSGEVPSNVLPELEKVRKASESIGSLGKYSGGQLSAPDLLALKRQGNWLGYTAAGNPATSLEAELANTQASSAREALEKLTSGESKKALRVEEALLKAKTPLTKPDTISQGLGSAAIFSKVPGQSLGFSTAAQAAQKLGVPAAEFAANPLLYIGLFSDNPQSEK